MKFLEYDNLLEEIKFINKDYYSVLIKNSYSDEMDISHVLETNTIKLEDFKRESLIGLWEIIFVTESGSESFYVFNEENILQCLTNKVLKLKPVKCDIEIQEDEICSTCINQVFYINSLYQILPTLKEKGNKKDLIKVIEELEDSCYPCGNC